MTDKLNPKIVLPLAVLGVALLGAGVLLATSSTVSGRPTERVLRAVRVAPVTERTIELVVRSQGTVSPRTESELIPEVSGRVVWTSPSLASGGYFAPDEPLLRIERTDYAATVARARAGLQRASVEHEHASQTLERQRTLMQRNVVSQAKVDDADRARRVADANLSDARVALEQAQRDLERTELRAPFRGRVREERVDVGQFLTRGQGFATLYATDYVEVRLPIADAQLAYLDVPLWARAPSPDQELPVVTLSARFAGRDHEWLGQIVRTEGEIDARSRLVHVVARVSNEDAELPLPVGLFVQARIAGRTAADVAVIPREALQGQGVVLVVDDEDRLRFRQVEVLRVEGNEALISSGLEGGERVCISVIQAPVDGMTVRPVDPIASASASVEVEGDEVAAQ